jgi:hypothetical protein
MDVLFKAVHEKLTKVDGIRWVDEDWGQLDIYENPPVTFPCALVSVQVPEWIPIKEPAVQPGKAQVIVKIGFDTRYKTGNAPATEIERAFAHFAIVKAVTLALRGMTGNTFRGLERLSTIKTVTEAGVKIYTVTFSSSIVEIIEAPEDE